MRTLQTHDVLLETVGQLRRLIVKYVRGGWVTLLDNGSGEEKNLRYEDIRIDFSKGKLKLEQPDEPALLLQAKRTPLEEQAEAKALTLTRALSDFSKRTGLSFKRAYQAWRDGELATPKLEEYCPLPSLPTVYRHAKKLLNGEYLYRGQACKGNRSPRYSEDVVNLIEDEAEKLYLIPHSRYTLTDFVKHARSLLRTSGSIACARLPAKNFIKEVVNKLAPMAEFDRMTPKERRAQAAVAASHLVVGLPLQRVELDAVHLPFLVQTPDGPSRDVWLVHAIDCCTSIPVGWKMVVGKPRSCDVMDCIEGILFSKGDAFQRLGIHGVPDVFGTPKSLVVDNGPENKTQLPGLAKLQIDVSYCKSNTPSQKPYIERINRSLKAVLQTLPGSTRLNGKDGARDPVACGDPEMSLEKLENWIVRWYYEVWITKPLKRLQRAVFIDLYRGSTPLQVWNECVNELKFCMPLPISRTAWRLCRCERVERTLARTTGLTYDTFHFGGPNLHKLIKRVGESEVTVLVDREDFRQVEVILPDSDELIPLTNKRVDVRTPAYSFEAAKTMLRQKAVEEPTAASEAFYRDLFAASAAPAVSSRKRPSPREQNKQTTQRSREREAFDKAQRVPVQAHEAAGADQPGQLPHDWTLDSDDAFCPTVNMHADR